MNQYYPHEFALPEWEQALFNYQEDTDPFNLDALAHAVDPKDDLRTTYAGRKHGIQDHGDAAAEEGLKDKRTERHDGRMYLGRRLTRPELIAESLEGDVDPDDMLSTYDYLDNNPKFEDSNVFPSYDGPYNPDRERQKARDAVRTARDNVEEKASRLIEELTAGVITEGEAAQQLFSDTYGLEREHLLEMVGEYLGQDSLGYEAVSPMEELGVVGGTGSLAARQTIEYNPFDDQDFVDGFHIVRDSQL